MNLRGFLVWAVALQEKILVPNCLTCLSLLFHTEDYLCKRNSINFFVLTSFNPFIEPTSYLMSMNRGKSL